MNALPPSLALDWNDLRDLLEIAEAGSLSAAARVLGVSQSTMSRRLAALEARGVVAFARDPVGRLLPTPAGARLIAAARQMREGFAEAQAALTAMPPAIRLASCEVTARLFLADALPDWGLRHPGRPVDHAVHDDLFTLPAAAWDVLVTPMEAVPPGALSLGEIRFGLYRAVTGEAWRLGPGAPVIAAGGSLAQVPAYRWLDAQGGRAVVRVSSPLAQLEACAREQGLALLPAALGDADGRLVRVPGPVPAPAQVVLLAAEGAADSPRLAPFLRWARRHFGRRLAA